MYLKRSQMDAFLNIRQQHCEITPRNVIPVGHTCVCLQLALIGCVFWYLHKKRTVIVTRRSEGSTLIKVGVREQSALTGVGCAALYANLQLEPAD